MKIEEIKALTNANIICGEIDGREVEKGFCSDLMSDVLTIDTDQLLLITGLSNVQTIRTAEMADVQCILLVRGKKATSEMITVAEENGVILLETAISMFHAAGKLYEGGLKPVF